MLKKHMLRWVIYLVIGLGIGFAINHFAVKKPAPSIEASAPVKRLVKAPAGSLGGEFTLIDGSGNEVTNANFSDHYKLIFFGFTFCPAVCPTELQKIAIIMDELDPKVSEKITPLFITIDPERDTAEVVAQYVPQFHQSIVGLTGSAEQIEKVSSAFHVYAKKVENDFMDGYMIDHSAFMYLTDLENHVIAVYPSKQTPQEIAADIQARGL